MDKASDTIVDEEDLSIREVKRKREPSPKKEKKSKKRKLDKLVGWGESSSLWEGSHNLNRELSSQQEDEPIHQELIEKEIQSQTVHVSSSGKEQQQTSILNWSRMKDKEEEPFAVVEVKMDEKKPTKKNNKLTKKEMKEVKATSINIFDWLKPKKVKASTTSPQEEDDIIEKELEAEMMKKEKEERLLRMKKRQDIWRMSMDVKVMLEEMIAETVKISTRKMCSGIVNIVIERSWMRISEIELSRTRMMKVEQLKTLWRAKRQDMEFQRMMSTLERLQIKDLDMELVEVERMVERMVLEDTELDVITMDDVVMEEVDVSRDNRLAKVKKKQMELWCKELITELIMKAGTEARMKICRELVEGVVVDVSWNNLELRRILDELGQGDPNLARMVEQSLRKAREHMEAEVATQKRQDKLKILRKIWKEKKETLKYENMLSKLKELRLNVMGKEMEEIEMLLDAMILVEDEEWYFDLEMTLDTEQDVEMNSLEKMASNMETTMMEIEEEKVDETMETGDLEDVDPEMELELDEQSTKFKHQVDQDCQEESMMVVVSLCEEPHHHGGVCDSVSEHPTLPEKGWEGGQIFEHHATEGKADKSFDENMESTPKMCTHLLRPITYNNIKGSDRAAHATPSVSKNIFEIENTAHATHLGAEDTDGNIVRCENTVQEKPKPVCVQAISMVEPVLKDISDLRKACYRSKNCTQEKSPSLVGGIIERFHSIETVIPKWEEIEKDEKEWEECGGIRRGGRKVSKRMSELLDRFEKGMGEEEKEIQAMSSDVVSNSSFSKMRGRGDIILSEGSKSETNPNQSLNNDVSTNVVQLVDKTRSKACDWSTRYATINFVANGKPALKKRPREQESEISGVETKRIRPWLTPDSNL